MCINLRKICLERALLLEICIGFSNNYNLMELITWW
jgi:hypothetical protein